MTMETVPCNLCGSSDYGEYLVREDLNLFVPGQYRLVQCKHCQLIYLNPRPVVDEIFDYYLDEYDQYNIVAKEERSALVKWARRYGLWKRAKIILDRKKSGALLDVGCATGDFLSFMREYSGWRVWGLEPNQRAARYAQKHLNLNVFTDSLEDLELGDGSFDVVTMWNVMEHLLDPQSSLYTIERLLKDDGLLVISTPDVSSFDARLFGQYWIGFELPRHLYVFSLDTLTKMLAEAGFRVVDHVCLYGQHAAFASSLRFWLRARFGRSSITRVLEKIMLSYPVRILCSPFFFLATQLGNECSIPTVLAIKDHA